MQLPVLKDFFNIMWSGVDLFFVLSGFLIGGILLDQRYSEKFYSTFYGRRILRIVPLYAVLLLLFLVMARHRENAAANLLSYVTFTQNFVWAKVDHWGPSWTLVTWSLAVEEQFYLVLPLMIRCLPERWLPWVFAVMVGCAPAARWLCANVIYDNTTSTYVLLPCRMDALFIGVLAAWAVRQPGIPTALRRYRAFLACFAALLGFVLLRFAARGHADPLDEPMQGIGLLCVAAFYATILLLVSAASRPEISAALKPLTWLGFGAYSIYLFHLPLLEFAQTRVHPEWMADTVAAVLTALVAAVAWFAIEKPAIGFGHRVLGYGRQGAARVRAEPDLWPSTPF